ncbi:hypothetical protein ACH5RR_023185 [Cinchona calisaya]|uniref:Uncharacterized protein n=1 Tax=Cinchona calisaya TaxID=153742 RepID=A0ABD2Z9Z6_9GENT
MYNSRVTSLVAIYSQSVGLISHLTTVRPFTLHGSSQACLPCKVDRTHYPIPFPVAWKRPLLGSLKFNVDGSAQGGHQSGGGGLICYSTSQLLHALSNYNQQHKCGGRIICTSRWSDIMLVQWSSMHVH